MKTKSVPQSSSPLSFIRPVPDRPFLNLLLTAVLLVIGAVPIRADIQWTNALGGLWSDAANWSPNQVPGAADSVQITNSGTYVVTLDVDATVGFLRVGKRVLGQTETVTLAIANRGLTLGSLSVISGGGVLDMSGGSVLGAGSLNVVGRVQFSGGSLGVPLLVTNTGTLNWTGGALLSDGSVTVARNGVLNVSGSEGKALWGPLTNAGVVSWTGDGDIEVFNNGDNPYRGAIYNLGGGVFNIQNERILRRAWWAGSGFFNNAGTVRKSGGAGVSSMGITFTNTGVVEVESGTLSFNGGGSLSGTFTGAAGATISLGDGAFICPSVLFSGAGVHQLTGGSLTLLDDAIPNLQMVGGTVWLGPLFQGGSITNLTLAGASLAGTNVVTGVLNWTGGSLGYAGSSLTIAPSGVLNVSGDGWKELSMPLTNAGTINWGGDGSWAVGYDGGSHMGSIHNLGGGLFHILNDRELQRRWSDNVVFNNAGTVRKSGGTGVSTISLVYTNTGVVEVESGTLNFNGGGGLSGTFTADVGATVTVGGGSFISSAVVFSGPGVHQLTGGSLTLLDDAIPNLQMVGGTVWLGPMFQGGSITNLTVAGSVLSGTNVVTGVLNWTGGSLGYAGSSLTIAPSGVLNVSGDGWKELSMPLTNAGTINWGGDGSWAVGYDGGSHMGSIHNLGGGLFHILNDRELQRRWSDNVVFNNAGTVRKSGGTGVSTISLVYTNTGVVEVESGTLNFNGGGGLSGTFTADVGATVTVGGGSFISSAVVFSGPGVHQLTGGSLTLLDDAIPNLQMVGGTVWLGPMFQGGSITNLTVAGSVLSGTNVVTGVLNWTGGSLGYAGSSLTIAPSGVLNVSGDGWKELSMPLTNAGTINWGGDGSWAVGYDGGSHMGSIHNLGGGLFHILNDRELQRRWSDNVVFNNAGTVRKSGGTGVSTISLVYTNTGVVEVESGTLNFNGGGGLSGTFTADVGATVTVGGGSFISSAVVFSGAGVHQLTGGSLTLLDDAIPNLQMVGGTVWLGPMFQGGSITNLTVAGSVLSGTNVVTGVLNWTGGSLGYAGSSLTIAPSGVLNVSGDGWKELSMPLTNAGTINWGGDGSWAVGYDGGSHMGSIHNLGGGLFHILNDRELQRRWSDNVVFNNAGTVRKSGGTGVSTISLVYTNTGVVEVESGTLNFNGGGGLSGTFTADVGATVTVGGGSFISSAVVFSGAGVHQLTGGSLTLLDDAIPNLQMVGGTVWLGPMFQGGSITNLTVAGSVLSGTNVVTGVLNWTGGSLGYAGSSLTIAPSGVLNVSGDGWKELSMPLTNAGTINWGGDGSWAVGYDGGSHMGSIHNLGGGLFHILNDRELQRRWSDNVVFNNAGTVRKSGGTGVSTISLVYTNTGVVEVESGTLNFNGGGGLSGTFTADVGATVTVGGGSFISSAVVFSGAGVHQLTGGSLTLLDDAIPNLQMVGGTVWLGPMFQGGSITNLTVAGSVLSGTNVVTGVLNWTGGSLGYAGSSLTIAPSGVLNVSGSNQKELSMPLTNAGTINWGGDGSWAVGYDGGSHMGSIHNLGGGLFHILNDRELQRWWSDNVVFNNAGTVRKSGGTGVSTISLVFTNTGVVEVQTGMLGFNGNYSGNPTASLATSVGGLTPGSGYSQIRFSNPPLLEGTFSLSIRDGYRPEAGDAFSVVEYPSATGMFTAMTGLDLGGGLVLQPQYTATSLLLTVPLHPSIASQPQSLTVLYGQSASFSVTAGGSPPLAYQWQRNGINLADSGNVTGANSSTLTLGVATAGEAGDYRVIVTNAFGSYTSTVATLTVLSMPMFTAQPESLVVTNGGVAVFQSFASGAPPLTYQWQRNGINLADGGNVSGATSSALTVSPASSADVGSYQVVVANSFGVITSHVALLTVVSAPLIGSQPQSQAVLNGSPAVFAVAASGAPPLAYQWQKNGVNLTDDGPVSGANSALLTLAAVTAGDAGHYRVIVSNTHGAVTSAVATLTVIQTDQAQPMSPGSYTQNFDTLANAPAGNTNWVDGVTLPGWYAGQANSAVPEIRNYRVNDGSSASGGLQDFGTAGSTERALGSIASADGLAHGVRFTNDTLRTLSNVTVSYVGEQWRNSGNPAAQVLRFECLVGAGPLNGVDVFNANPGWMRVPALDFTSPVVGGAAGALDGNQAAHRHAFVQVPLTGVSVAPGQELFLRWSDVVDPGASHGLAIDDVVVTFAQPPVITSQPQSLTVTNGDPATFSVTADGQGTAGVFYQWFFNGQPIPNATNTQFALAAVTRAQAGTYWVMVSGLTASTRSADATLTVLNRLPVAWPVNVGLQEDSSAALTLEGTDADGDPLTYLYTAPAHGTLSGVAPHLAYAPHANYFGSDSFSYRVSDGSGTSAVAMVAITVLPVNDPPVARDNLYATDAGVPLVVAAPGVLGNDTDVENDPLTARVLSTPLHGVLVLSASGGFTYTPAVSYHGADSFTYAAWDGNASSAAATVVIQVRGLNEAPVARVAVAPLFRLFPEQTNLTVLAANNSNAVVQLDASASTDADGDPLEYFWYSAGAGIPFGAGVRMTNRFAVGFHSVVLQVDDGKEMGIATVLFEVMTAGDAAADLGDAIAHAALPKQRSQSLLASCRAAEDSFNRGSLNSGVNQLQALQAKFRAQVAPLDPALATRWTGAAQHIIDGVLPP